VTTGERDDGAETRRRLIRRAGLYTWGLFATALLVAFGGAALVALLIRVPGVSYVRMWLILSAVVLLPSAVGYLVQRFRESARRARRDASSGE
jgi:hypothetical protein